jgi:hypothetical protein
MPQVLLDWERFLRLFKKGIFLYFERFLPYLGFCEQNLKKMALLRAAIFCLEIGHTGIKN